MGWWNKKNMHPVKAVKTRGWFNDELGSREICYAKIVDRPSNRSELKDPRQRRVDICGRYIYR